MKPVSSLPAHLRRLTRRRPSPAMVIALIALFIALGGTATALQGRNTVFSDDITNQEVKSPDIAQQHVRSPDLKNNGVKGLDIQDGGIGGVDIEDDGVGAADLQVNSVFMAHIAAGSVASGEVADNTLTGTDIANNSLTGTDVNESSLSVPGMGCQSGKVLGFALVEGNNTTFPTTYTTSNTYRKFPNNCAGGGVEVRRSAEGQFYVRFPGNPAAIAVVSGYVDGPNVPDNAAVDNVLSVQKITSGADNGAFLVRSLDPEHEGGGFDDADFTIMLP